MPSENDEDSDDFSDLSDDDYPRATRRRKRYANHIFKAKLLGTGKCLIYVHIPLLFYDRCSYGYDDYVAGEMDLY